MDANENNVLKQRILEEQFDALKPLVMNLSHKCQVMPVEQERNVPEALKIDKLTGKKINRYTISGKGKNEITKEMESKVLSDSNEALPNLISCFFLENVPYEEIKELTLKFLHKNTAIDENSYVKFPETRYTHTIKLALICLLAAKKFNKDATTMKRMLNHALGHDVGHVALAHANESVIHEVNDLWWHPIQSGIEIRRTLSNFEDKIINKLTKRGLKEEEIKVIYKDETDNIVYSAQCHNKNVSDRRGETFEAQIVKMFDKIISDFTDVFDFIYNKDRLKFSEELGIVNERVKDNALLKSEEDFFSNKLKDNVLERLESKGIINNLAEEEEITKHIDEICELFNSTLDDLSGKYKGPAEYISYIIDSLSEEDNYYNLPNALYNAIEGIRQTKFKNHIYNLYEDGLKLMSRAFIIEKMEERIKKRRSSKRSVCSYNNARD